MKILLTGGAGYIGSHTALTLLEGGHEVEVIDNFSTGSRSNIEVLGIPCFEFDIQATEQLKSLLVEKKYEVVVHFAGSAYVEESFQQPEKYYHNNVLGAMSLLYSVRAMEKPAKIIFSSTCSIYGIPSKLPIIEETPPLPISPYGRSKLMVEWMLNDWHNRYQIPYAILRYFNAAGCHPDKKLGEIHNPEPHLIPKFIIAALQKKPVCINGKNFPTEDGTCIRDYIHVSDLAKAHLLVAETNETQPMVLNLGTGKGTSILQILRILENILGYSLDIEWVPPREGDPPILVAEASKAMETLNWTPIYSSMEQILKTSLSWFEKHFS